MPFTGKLAISGNANEPFVIPYNAVIDMLFNNTDGGEHPLHFHGHKFWLLATSDYPEAEILYADNYLRRDIVSVPAMGWAKIRFVADNPGVWLLHCHISWHVNAGFTSKVIEAPLELYSGLLDNTIRRIPLSQLKACPNPTLAPSAEPTAAPSAVPSVSPSTLSPSAVPSVSPSTLLPSAVPSVSPSTLLPSAVPSTVSLHVDVVE